MDAPLSAFFRPRTVAVVGASVTPGKVGNRMMGRLLASPADLMVVPVNPNPGPVLGMPAVSSLRDIDSHIDLVVITTPADTVPGIVRDCVDLGVGAVMIHSAGFGEVGPHGADLQEQLASYSAASGIPLIGPNCAGVMDFHHGFHANFSPIFDLPFRAGGVAVIAQSGGFAGGLCSDLRKRGVGISKVVTLGNECATSAAEFVAHLRDDPDTKIIVTYIEQIRDAAGFLDEVAATTPTKPVVVEKTGRTAAGAQAAASHTAALASSAKVVSAALRQAGALEARSMNQALDMACGLLTGVVAHPGAATPSFGVAVLSQGGGSAVELADLCDEHGLGLPILAEATEDALSRLMPSYASARNPVDFADIILNHPEILPKCASVVAADPSVDAIILVLSSVRGAGSADAIVDAVNSAGIPVAVTLLSEAGSSAEVMQHLHDRGIHTFASTEGATRGMRALAAHRTGTRPAIGGRSKPAPADLTSWRNVVKTARADDRSGLTEHEVGRALERSGIAVPPQRLINDVSELPAALAVTGYPAVLKLMSPDVLHKTERGAVHLGCQSLEDATRAYHAVLASSQGDGTVVHGVLVQRQYRPLVEVIVGMTVDATFGPVLACGPGGVLAELLDDTQLVVLPTDRSHLRDLLTQSKLGAMLAGWRGGPPADEEALLDLILTFGEFASQVAGDVTSIELNPVAVMPPGDGAVALDAAAWLRH